MQSSSRSLERARARWTQSHPAHYQFRTRLKGWKLNIWDETWDVEVQADGAMTIIDPSTGSSPDPFALQEAQGFLRIEDLFERLAESNVRPSTPGEYLARAFPEASLQIVNRGWLPGNLLDAHCRPAFPGVTFDRQFGFPEYISYRSNECTAIPLTAFSTVEIWIDQFALLP
jgi:hypothetical protein